jgi:hypothetical protein
MVPPLPERPSFTDRSTGLVIFGVAQIILGLLSALMVPLVALGAVLSRMGPGGRMRPLALLSAVSTYVFIAAVLIILGIGSVQKKRWARALTLITSWYWLVMGVLITVLMTAVLPLLMRTALQQQQGAGESPSAQLSTGAMAIIVTLVIVFLAFFVIVVPVAFVAFYSRRDVAATCRERDPVERWTDRTPLPVLGASVVFAIGALYLFMVGFTTPVFPFFGRYLYGFAGAACFLFVSALDAYLAIAFYRIQTAGWWLATIALPIRLFSMALTYFKADLMSAYSRMGRSDAELKMLQSSPIFRSHVILWWSLISLVIFFGYLMWVKRYFNPARPTPGEMSAAPSI